MPTSENALICRQVGIGQLHGDGESLQCQNMTTFTQLTSCATAAPRRPTETARSAAASAAGIRAAVRNSGGAEGPCTTGTAWVEARNLDLAAPSLGW